MAETEPVTTRYALNDAHLWELVANVWYWRGQFIDPRTALDWVHQNGAGKVYEVNNIPPPTSNSFHKGKPMETGRQPQHAIPRNTGSVNVSRVTSAGYTPPKVKKPSAFALEAARRLNSLKDDEAQDMDSGKVEDLR